MTPSRFEARAREAVQSIQRNMPEILLQAFALPITQALEEAYADGLRRAAEMVEELYNGFHSPSEYSENVSDAIRAEIGAAK